MNNKMKAVKSFHLCKTVIQTWYEMVKAQGGEFKVETLPAEAAA
jgi:hypothetical protein